ncbi:MAG: hypothetical protein K2N72_01230 [Oscillospiraceae bacterium]|nr:hypothetical protein [Oscillospiraceae bacterium]MDE7293026.1 hypothetical protein [Oscillospiraceae bacterium]
MSDQELCTQYELIVTLLKSDKQDKVIEILEDAIERIKGTSNKDSKESANS